MDDRKPTRLRWMTGTALAVVAAVAVAAVATPQGPDPVAAIAPLTDGDFLDDGAPPPEMVELGRLLSFDKILSGNRNISCATCHHPTLASADAVSLSLGEGASGLGTDRAAGPDQPVLGRIPRNSPALFNIGAREYVTMFHDGRVEPDTIGSLGSGFWTPAREQLPPGLDSLLAAQAMFPVLSEEEMAGHEGENEIADAVATNRLGGPGGAWDLLAARLRAIPDYVVLFQEAFPEIDGADEITFVHAANAIAAFEATAFRADGSPFDTYLRERDPTVLPVSAQRGMDLFYGDAGCAACHAGALQTDHGFHAIAMPQIGPGRGHGRDDSYWRATGFHARLEDFGRYAVTFDPADLYRFRTPSLRNVALTGPWGHAGAYATLEGVVRHHLDPVAALEAYDIDQALLAPAATVIEPTGQGSELRFDPVNPARRADHALRDGWVQQTDALRGSIADANELPSRTLSDGEIDDLLAFLHALTDPTSRELDHLVPTAVPSGLPVAD